jgi:hypothetical protein
VWAKECFKLLFGNATDSMLYEDQANTGTMGHDDDDDDELDDDDDDDDDEGGEGDDR